MSELKPCPLCNSENVRLMEAFFDGYDPDCLCMNCGCKADKKAWSTRTQSQYDLYDELYKAALGLTKGFDWNNGNHAIIHGYREKLINVVNKIKALSPKEGE